MHQSNSGPSSTPTPINSSVNTPNPSSISSPASVPVLTTAKVVAATGSTAAAIKAYDSHQVTLKNSAENKRADGLIKQTIYKKLKNPSFQDEDAINELQLQGIQKEGILEVLEMSHRLEKDKIYDIKNHKLCIIGSRTKENLVESSVRGHEDLEILNDVQEKANVVQVNLKNLKNNMSPEELEACSSNIEELSYNADQTAVIVKKGQNAIINRLRDGEPISDEKIEAASSLAGELTRTLEQNNAELTETVESFDKERADSMKIKKGSSRSSMGSLSETICSNYNQQENQFSVGESFSIDKPTEPDFGARNSFLFLGVLFAFCFYLVDSYQKNQQDNKEFKNLIKNNPLLDILIDYKSKKINLKETKTLLLNNSSLSDQAINEILNNF